MVRRASVRRGGLAAGVACGLCSEGTCDGVEVQYVMIWAMCSKGYVSWFADVAAMVYGSQSNLSPPPSEHTSGLPIALAKCRRQ